MTNNPDKLHRAMFAEIRRLRQASESGGGDSQNRVLGAFIDAALTNTGRSRAEFAKAMDMDAELVDALLEGLLPESIVTDPTLTRIAQVIGYEPNVLRALLDRAIEPDQEDKPARNTK